MLDGFQQLGVFLAHDLVKLRGPHPGFLQLLEGLSGIDALMLAGVADQQNLVLRADLVEEVPHLLRRCERGFIDHIEMLLRRVVGGLQAARKKALQGVGGDASIAELVRGAARSAQSLRRRSRSVRHLRG